MLLLLNLESWWAQMFNNLSQKSPTENLNYFLLAFLKTILPWVAWAEDLG